MNDLVREAVRLNARMKVSGVRGGIERLLELAPQVEEALKGELEGEEWAQAALTLVLPFVRMGRFREFGEYLERAREEAETSETRHWVVIYHIQWLWMSGYAKGSVAMWEQLQLASLPPLQRVHANYHVIRAYRQLGEFEKARQCAVNAVDEARRESLVVALCKALEGLGMLELMTGHPEAALRALEESYVLNQRKIRDPHAALALESDLGTTFMKLRNFASAKRHLERARELAVSLEMQAQQLSIWFVETTVILALGQYEEASRNCDSLKEALWTKDGFVEDYGLVALEAIISTLQAPRDVAIELVRNSLERVRLDGDRSTMCSLEMLLHVLEPDSNPMPEYVPSLVFSPDFFSLLSGAPEAKVQELEAGLIPIERDLWALKQPPKWVLWAEEGFWRVSLDGREWIDLRRRASTRQLLEILYQSYPEPIGSWELFEKIWPDVKVKDDRSLGRLYTCIYRLNGLGMEGVVVSVGQAYSLSGPIKITAPD